jgi:hypothetical protein
MLRKSVKFLQEKFVAVRSKIIADDVAHCKMHLNIEKHPVKLTINLFYESFGMSKLSVCES